MLFFVCCVNFVVKNSIWVERIICIIRVLKIVMFGCGLRGMSGKKRK